MFLFQRRHFLLHVFQMTAIALLSVMNRYHTNGLHLFWDTLNENEKKKKNGYRVLYKVLQKIFLKLSIWHKTNMG